jgi:hypothetical protein
VAWAMRSDRLSFGSLLSQEPEAARVGSQSSMPRSLLLYEHLERGYQAVLIQRDIDEGQNLFQPGVRQVFYFDDFMGATFLGDQAVALTGTNDRALLDFIAMVRATTTARLILTTREHIYARAMDRSERLRLSDLNELRVFLHLPSYSFAQKARILYNHLYFSDLPSAYQDELLRDNFYFQIIKHDKFNPRLIEWLSSFRRIRNTPVQQYRRFTQNLLNDPSEIGRHAYEQEMTNAARSEKPRFHEALEPGIPRLDRVSQSPPPRTTTRCPTSRY